MRPRVLALLAIPAALGLWLALRAPATPAHEAASPSADPAANAANAVNAANAPNAANGEGGRALATDGATSSTSALPAASGIAATNDAPSGDASRAHVVATAPGGKRVPLDEPLVVRFDRAPDHAAVSVHIEPPAEGQIAWPEAQVLKFTPARWAEGKPYHVRIEGAGVEGATFEMRTLVPPPARIEPGRGERIVLTFDDGADKPARVTALLDLLEKEQAEAIFFPIGKWAEANPRLVERMIAGGHRVCNHTYSHQNLRLPQLTDGEIHTEIARGTSDGKCRLFRPPLKAFDARVERMVAAMGLTLYLWDVDSRDWEGAETEDIVNLVLGRAHPGAVVLFHMHSEATLAALPTLFARLRKAGYVFRDPPDAGTP